MSPVIVDLTLAVICFLGQCHNALVGPDTPVGTFPIVHATTDLPGYGGDVLVFKEDSKYVYAIHRVWLLKPSQRRAQRLASNNVSQRVTITNGCINVDPEVYEQLKACTECTTLVVNRVGHPHFHKGPL